MDLDHVIQKTVVLAGNPNVGKSTLFNQLTGSHQKIANYPGVTVEKHIGRMTTQSGQHLTLIDLPGTYSLNTKSEDEAIAQRCIVEGFCDLSSTNKSSRQDPELLQRPDVVVVVAEASKLNRSLLLFTQIQRVHSQVILAVNMMDELDEFKMQLDTKKLSKLLKVPVVPLTSTKGKGVCELISAIEQMPILSANDSTSSKSDENLDVSEEFKKIDQIVRQVLIHQSYIEDEKKHVTDKMDAVLLHPFFGPIIFFAVMLFLFQALFTWSTPLMDLIDGGFTSLSGWVQSTVSIPWLSSLLSDGIIAGVGSVVIFVPQIAIAFLLIGFLEMSGYLARGSFLIDRLMRIFGLEGKAFVPLISSFACAIPGIMATRTMSHQRQRLITTLIAPLMTCSARLPVYILLIACFVPATKVFGFVSLQGITLFSLFLAGIIMGLLMAFIFNKALPKGTSGQGSFFMELPRYRWPLAKTLYHYVTKRTGSFLKTAGTVIFLLSLILWALGYFPRSEAIAQKYNLEREKLAQMDISSTNKEEMLMSIDNQESGDYLRHSFMGQIGHFIEPALAPMGFDWKLGIGVLSSFAAREVFVSTMGVVFNLGDANEESQTLRQKLQSATKADGSQAYTLRTALALMIFFAFAAQCMSTLAVIKRETNSSKWAAFTFVYMTLLAYAAATLTYQGLGWLGFS